MSKPASPKPPKQSKAEQTNNEPPKDNGAQADLENGLNAWQKNMGALSERLQSLSKLYLEQSSEKFADAGESAQNKPLDPLNIGKSLMELQQSLLQNPSNLWAAQMELMGGYMSIWQQTTRKFMGLESEAIITPEKDDKRFKADAWNENFAFDLIKQSYLLTAKATQNMVQNAEGLDDKTAQKLDFYTKQFVDALSPSNFAMTNPAVLDAIIETKGENLVSGLDNLIQDLQKGDGKQVKITMTDGTKFELGKNIATAQGSVVFKNELMELLQFDPVTPQVQKRPLLIIPPWINKYYILDLGKHNSMIQWLVGQGFTVFCISWVNPDASLKHKSFEDYMIQGPLAALDAIALATGERDIDAVGYCLGGTLLSATLSIMETRKDKRIKSATYFTTMVDFENPGDLGVFIDEAQLTALEEKMNERGYLDGSEMATTFNMLRSNDLIWSFVINNYLLGKQPFPFDLLYWNSDSTRMPATMHSYYLRNMYQKNLLIQDGALKLDGVPVKLSNIKVPSFILSTREDHIAPWESSYQATKIYKGPVDFVLAGSGHIAGVINPPNPEKQKYGYWVNEKHNDDPLKWLDQASHHQGSWWPYWREWLVKKHPEQVPARKVGAGKLKKLAPAPGDYVKQSV
ncbi:MAG: PHA/PHB synthase family protein [Alphaproteobacteria bacterium]